MRLGTIRHTCLATGLGGALLLGGALAAAAAGPPQEAAPALTQATPSEAADRSRPPQAPGVPRPPADRTGGAIDTLPGRHLVRLTPSEWLTLARFEEHPGLIPVDLCGRGLGDTFADEPVVLAGYDHGACDGALDAAFQGFVRFDLGRLAGLGRTTVYRAELRYREEPGTERAPGGGALSVFQCATRLAPALDPAWLPASHVRPGRGHWADSAGAFPLATDDARGLTPPLGRVDLTPSVLGWLAYPGSNLGLAFAGDTLSLDGDRDACTSTLRDLELWVDYEVLR